VALVVAVVAAEEAEVVVDAVAIPLPAAVLRQQDLADKQPREFPRQFRKVAAHRLLPLYRKPPQQAVAHHRLQGIAEPEEARRVVAADVVPRPRALTGRMVLSTTTFRMSS
jgi:hypothetical protein